MPNEKFPPPSETCMLYLLILDNEKALLDRNGLPGLVPGEGESGENETMMHQSNPNLTDFSIVSVPQLFECTVSMPLCPCLPLSEPIIVSSLVQR